MNIFVWTLAIAVKSRQLYRISILHVGSCHCRATLFCPTLITLLICRLADGARIRLKWPAATRHAGWHTVASGTEAYCGTRGSYNACVVRPRKIPHVEMAVDGLRCDCQAYRPRTLPLQMSASVSKSACSGVIILPSKISAAAAELLQEDDGNRKVDLVYRSTNVWKQVEPSIFLK